MDLKNNLSNYLARRPLTHESGLWTKDEKRVVDILTLCWQQVKYKRWGGEEEWNALNPLFNIYGDYLGVKVNSIPTIEELEVLIAQAPTSTDRTSWTKAELRVVMTLFDYWCWLRNYDTHGELLNQLFLYPGGDYTGVNYGK